MFGLVFLLVLQELATGEKWISEPPIRPRASQLLLHRSGEKKERTASVEKKTNTQKSRRGVGKGCERGRR